MLRRTALAAFLSGSIGCVERTIRITSTPTGALVHLNDEEVGGTPLEVRFTFFGTYDVRVEHETDNAPRPKAAAHYGVTEKQVEAWAGDQQADVRTREDGERLYEINYAPLWAKAEAKPPVWEYPGPDLVAEAIPGRTARSTGILRSPLPPPEATRLNFRSLTNVRAGSAKTCSSTEAW